MDNRNSSPTITSLLDYRDIDLIDRFPTSLCPQCIERGRKNYGRLIQKTGPHGQFLGCSRFPTCTFSCRLPKKEYINFNVKKTRRGI